MISGTKIYAQKPLRVSLNVEWMGNKLAVAEINDDERIPRIFLPTLVVIIHIIFNVIINFERENLMALWLLPLSTKLHLGIFPTINKI